MCGPEDGIEAVLQERIVTPGGIGEPFDLRQGDRALRKALEHEVIEPTARRKIDGWVDAVAGEASTTTEAYLFHLVRSLCKRPATIRQKAAGAKYLLVPGALRFSKRRCSQKPLSRISTCMTRFQKRDRRLRASAVTTRIPTRGDATATATIPVFVVPAPLTAVATPDAPVDVPAAVHESISVEGAILAESERINKLWEREVLERTRLEHGDAFRIANLSSFSIRFGETSGSTDNAGGIGIRIESTVNDGVLTLVMEQVGGGKSVHVVDYAITRTDGRAVPGWLERPSLDMLQGRRAADAEVLDLRVRAILSDGREIVQDVRIETPTGEIKPLPQQRSDRVPMFDEQLSRFASLDAESAEALADVLALAAGE